MSEVPTIEARETCVTIEMQTDGTGLRFSITPDAKQVCIDLAIAEYLHLSVNHIESDAFDDVSFNIYNLLGFEAQEVITKMRMVIACYEAIKAQNARDNT